MSDAHHICPNEKTLAALADEAKELARLIRHLTTRVEGNTTFLFGPERNGGGYVKAHQREHEEDAMALKETLEILNGGLQTTANTITDVGAKVQIIMDRKIGVRDIAKVSIPSLLMLAGTVITLLLTRAPAK